MGLRGAFSKLLEFSNRIIYNKASHSKVVYNKLVNMGNRKLQEYFEDSRYGRFLARQAVLGINQITTSFDKFKNNDPRYRDFEYAVKNNDESKIVNLVAPIEAMPKENYKLLTA